MSDRSYPARPMLAASVAVIRDGRVLLARRGKAPALGLFSLPGGLVELGELLEEAALRELGEEVGVTAVIVGFNDHVQVIERDSQNEILRHFVIASFVARWISGEGRTGPEAGEVAWVEPHALEKLETTKGLPRIIRRAFRVFEGHALAKKVQREHL